MHITIESMSELPFQSFRRNPLFRIRTRRLTEEDMQQRSGLIHTLEGPAAFKPGDYLAHGIQNEEWPITPEAFAFLCYEESATKPDLEGFSSYSPRPLIHQAVQIAKPFTVERKAGGIYTGKAGDYLVRTAGRPNGRIVDRTIFEQTYELITSD